MAVYEVFSHPEMRVYKSQFLSKATFIQIVILFLTIIAPLFVVYRSYGFWIREDYFREIPDVAFKHEMLLVVQYNEGSGTNPARYATWSTFQNYNLMFQLSSALTMPFVKSREVDTNGNGKNDRLELSLEVTIPDSARVHNVQLMLFFQYRLYKFVTLTMESMAYIEHGSAIAGAALDAFGELRFKQKQPLAHRGTDTRYNTSIVNHSSIFAEDFLFSNIIKNYTSRNSTTVYDNAYYVWQTGRGAGQPFVISVQVVYPEDVYLYTPGFWFLIKWGWVQYVAVFLLFSAVFKKIKANPNGLNINAVAVSASRKLPTTYFVNNLVTVDMGSTSALTVDSGWFERGVKESAYIRVCQPTLYFRS